MSGASFDPATIETRLRATMPKAEIVIQDPRGDGEYLIVHVGNEAFAGLSRLEQHRLVYKALGEAALDPPPTLALRTYAPAGKP